jgi:hypothetical protein
MVEHSELEHFILTKYDPLLQIVKQLTARFSEAESDRIESQRRQKALEIRLSSLEAQVGAPMAVNNSGMPNRPIMTQLDELDATARKSRKTQKTQAERLQQLSDANQTSEARFVELSTQLEGLSTRLEVWRAALSAPIPAAVAGGAAANVTTPVAAHRAGTSPAPRGMTHESGFKGENLSDGTSISDEELRHAVDGAITDVLAESPGQFATSLHAPWLFKVAGDTQLGLIQEALGYGPQETAELDARTWDSEASLWRTVAIALQGVAPYPGQERSAVTAAFARVVLCEALFVIRGVPGREELRQDPESTQSRIMFVAQLAAEAQRHWDEATSSAPAEELGRLAIVLSGDGIGRSLRAGNMRFPIERLL